MPCCQCDGIERQFDRAEAARSLRRFRRRGPDRTTRLLIDALRAALEVADARTAVLLDIGGGVGAIHHEMLDGPVQRAVHVDASSAYLGAAREETDRRGHVARVEFVHGDFVSLAETLPAADVVTLDRVICCYGDMNALVSLSAAKATRFYGAVYPRGSSWVRFGIALINAFQRVKRSEFRAFAHDPDAIDTALRAQGLQRRTVRRSVGWEVVVYDRPRAASD